ncbi:transposase [Azospirillum sp.]|uniref:transposase n=1 Tax=Azospirillum sp. TaxID=34012 RepID=UPI003D751FAF
MDRHGANHAACHDAKPATHGGGADLQLSARRPLFPQGSLQTTLTPDIAPATELAALYHERWQHELVFAELKVTLPGQRLILRSRRPDLIEQELYGLLLAHFALRRLICQASVQAACDPDTLSFVHVVRVVRRHLPFHAAFFPLANASACGRPSWLRSSPCV